jgi:hypothetical protein
MYKLFKISLFGLTLLFFACQKDSDNPIPQTCGGNFKNQPGVLVVNEGPFGDGSGSISYLNSIQNQVTNDVFEGENCSKLGNVVQSISEHLGKYYIISNNSGRIDIVNGASFKAEFSSKDFFLPRYFLGINSDKAYITQWGANGISGSLVVFDLKTRKPIKTIPLAPGAEKMVRVGDKVYVCNSGGFGNSQKISVIDINSDTRLREIPITGFNARDIKISSDGTLWVLCRGTFETNPADNKPGSLLQIKNDAEVASFKVENGVDDLQISKDEKFLFFAAPSGVTKFEVASKKLEIIYPGYFYGLGYDSKLDQLYVADAGDFKSNGKVVTINTNGNKIKEYSVGIAPQDFYFIP